MIVIIYRKEGRIKHYSPQAFKFFMEQHVENVIKSYKQRLFRKSQLEKEMGRINLSEEAQGKQFIASFHLFCLL